VASELQRDVPVPVPEQKELWGSDAVAAMLRALDIPYLALNPGASFRGRIRSRTRAIDLNSENRRCAVVRLTAVTLFSRCAERVAWDSQKMRECSRF
jgi:hypothetical protein